ncbi:MAG: CRISPR-associated endonuclease Cas2 [Thermodesulfobacteriota bacterium]
MSRGAQHIIASYDIRDPKRLTKIAKIMKDYGERVLKSVFECNLEDGPFRKMQSRVDAVIDHMEDSVRFYFICEKCIGNVEVSGLGTEFLEDEELIIA